MNISPTLNCQNIINDRLSNNQVVYNFGLGANPITQLALTLANGFTYVEYYRSRGMDVAEFAPNLSFFFSSRPQIHPFQYQVVLY